MSFLRIPTLLALLAIVLTPLAHAYDPLQTPSASLPPPLDLDVRDGSRSRDIPVRIYLPAEGKAAPVILFSHGLGGSRRGSSYLGKHWSARGYVAVFLQHPGSDESVWKDQPARERADAMQGAASAANYLLRVKDVPAVLDQLERWNAESGHALAGKLDLTRVGMSGHSFGAVTTQAVSGQSAGPLGTRFLEPRIKAAVVFSPSTPAQSRAEKAFASVKIPWLLMTGTEDIANIGGRAIGAGSMASRLAVFPALPRGSKYELVLDGGQHFAFTDGADFGRAGARNPNHHRVILALSTAFWDAYLRQDQAAREWLDGSGPRTLLAEKDRWQTK